MDFNGYLADGIPIPSEKIVNWDYYSQCMANYNMFQTTIQISHHGQRIGDISVIILEHHGAFDGMQFHANLGSTTAWAGVNLNHVR